VGRLYWHKAPIDSPKPGRAEALRTVAFLLPALATAHRIAGRHWATAGPLLPACLPQFASPCVQLSKDPSLEEATGAGLLQ